MISSRLTAVFLVACCWLGRCVGPEGVENVGVDDHRNAAPVGRLDAPIEVREQRYPDGTVSVRAEGRLDAEGNFVPHGPTTVYWPNGKKKSEVNYVHGIKHGPRTAWYEGGQIWSQGQNVNGREDGTWTVWFPNGRKAQEYHFKNGAWHGMHTEWHANGRMSMQVEFVMGKRQGAMTQWDENGVVVRKTDYVDGVAQP